MNNSKDSSIVFSAPVQQFLEEVDNDISKFDDEQLGMYLLDVKNDYWQKFSSVVEDTLKAVPQDKRTDFMYELQDSSSVFGANLPQGLL